MVSSVKPDDTFVEYVCDQLAGLDGVNHRPMFGGYGIYCGVVFFAIVYRDRLYFKTDEATRQKFEGWGMAAFQPNAKQKLKSYYEVPVDYLEEAARLLELAEEAVDVAVSGGG